MMVKCGDFRSKAMNGKYAARLCGLGNRWWHRYLLLAGDEVNTTLAPLTLSLSRQARPGELAA